jgi:hypothetical protein
MPQLVFGKVIQPCVNGAPNGVVRSKLPLELTCALVKACPYTVTGNGSEMVVTQSSQWLPVSVVPAVIVLPVVVEVV